MRVSVVDASCSRTHSLWCGNREIAQLNPAFPPARNARIARAAGLTAILTDDSNMADKLPAPVVVVDATTLARLRVPAANAPARSGGPDDIAYILFTSGSTGAPKGVPIRQRNAGVYLDHVVGRYAVGPGSRLSQTFELTFDPSVFDMFVAWSTGATLVVPARTELMSVARFVVDRQVTHWFSVPSVISLAQRLRRLVPGSMPDLRWSLFAGEQLTLAQARAWNEAAPQSRIENIYGPTELTVTCTQYRLPRDPAQWPQTPNGTVPIGRVYPHLEHLVMGADGRPAAEGELVVRGAQRFTGYLEPADDAGRFIAFDGAQAHRCDADAPLGDAHWYRTGDRVATHNGELVHLGRLDHQVKVQGYRVELGEIEAALRDQPGVRDAIVLAIPDVTGQTELFAAYTGTDVDPERLLSGLRQRLPPYMVPRTATALEVLPLSDNGKVDRRVLAAAVTNQEVIA